MEAVIFSLVFVLPFVAYVALHIRAGLAEDVQWSRQQMLIGHGVRLGLPARQQAVVQSTAAFVPVAAVRTGHPAESVTLPRPGGGVQYAPSLGSAL